MALQNRLQGLFSIKGGGGVPLYMVCGRYWVLNIPPGWDCRVLGIKCPLWVCEQIVAEGVGTNKSG